MSEVAGAAHRIAIDAPFLASGGHFEGRSTHPSRQAKFQPKRNVESVSS